MSTSQIPGQPPPLPPPQYPPQQQPDWGPYGPQPPRKRHRLRKWLLILTGVTAAFIGLVVALVIGLGSAVNHAANPNSAPKPPATAQPAASNPVTPTPSTPTVLAQGDPASISTNGSPSATVTVTSVTTSTTPADPQFGSNPQNGYFVVANMTVATDPSFTQGFNINPLDFYALNGATQYTEGSGNAFNALSSASQELNATTLGAGQKTSGPIVFDVSSPHGYIVYAPNLNGQPLAEWKY